LEEARKVMAFVESHEEERNPKGCHQQHSGMSVLDHTRARLKWLQQAEVFPDPAI
jgi:hypothetical protein